MYVCVFVPVVRVLSDEGQEVLARESPQDQSG